MMLSDMSVVGLLENKYHFMFCSYVYEEIFNIFHLFRSLLVYS